MENTIGDVPIQWFRDEEHIGYDADGRKILKRARVDHLDHLLQMVDDPTYWRKVFDEREDKEISISREQVRPARRRSFAQPPFRVLVPSCRR
jgi:ribosome biogenesis protein ERB1